MRHRTAYRSQQTRPNLFWDPTANAYGLKTQQSDKFINDLKIICDIAPTFSGGSNPLWYVAEADVENVKAAIAAHFPPDLYGTLIFTPKPDPNQRSQQQHSTQSNGAAAAALLMFEIGGYAQAKKVYSLLIRQFHPDSGGETADHAKAAQLTLAWREIKQHYGWS